MTSDAAHVCDLRAPSALPAATLLPPATTRLTTATIAHSPSSSPPLAFSAIAVAPPPVVAPLLALTSARELLLWDVRALRAPVQQWNLPFPLRHVPHREHFLSFCGTGSVGATGSSWGGGLSLQLIMRSSGLRLSFSVDEPCHDASAAETQIQVARAAAAGDFCFNASLQRPLLPQLLDGRRQKLRVLARAECLLGGGATVFPLAGGALVPGLAATEQLPYALPPLSPTLFMLTREGSVLCTHDTIPPWQAASKAAIEVSRLLAPEAPACDSCVDVTATLCSRKCALQSVHPKRMETVRTDLGKAVAGEEGGVSREAARVLDNAPLDNARSPFAADHGTKGIAEAACQATRKNAGAGVRVESGLVNILRQKWYAWRVQKQNTQREVTPPVAAAAVRAASLAVPTDTPLARVKLQVQGPIDVTPDSLGPVSTRKPLLAAASPLLENLIAPFGIVRPSESEVAQLTASGRSLISRGRGHSIVSTGRGPSIVSRGRGRSIVSRETGKKRRRGGGF